MNIDTGARQAVRMLQITLQEANNVRRFEASFTIFTDVIRGYGKPSTSITPASRSLEPFFLLFLARLGESDTVFPVICKADSAAQSRETSPSSP